MRLLKVLLGSALLTLAVAPAALAEGAYPRGGIEGVNASQASGSLPFTGLNLVLLVLAACLLVGTGLVLRRRSASSK